MSTTAPGGPNAEQIQYWNETAGPRWVTAAEMVEAHIGAFGLRAMERAGVGAGERVLDVGCGCGDTVLELARRVGPSGRVVGIDVSAPMLARARERAAAAQAANVHLELTDAQTHAFAGAFDVVFSRFGVMFFVDPVAAFTNLLAALRPGGRLGFVCWQTLAENPWFHVPLAAALRHIALPPPPAPGAPGPFAFGEAGHVRGILERAGFADIAVEPFRTALTLGGGGGLDAAVEFLLQLGPTASALRDADPALRPTVTAAVREALAPFVTPAGPRLGAAAWIVTARRRP
jgi:SAM-dependent methyltransferase